MASTSERLDVVDDTLDKNGRTLTELSVKVEDLRSAVGTLGSKIDHRPSWAVTVYIAGTSSLAAGLLGGLIGVHVHP